MRPSAQALLEGDPLRALDLARDAEGDGYREDAVRALVALVRPREAAEVALPTGRAGVVGRAWVALAVGEPGRGRAALARTGPPGEVLEALTLAALHRACGDAAMAVQVAARAEVLGREADPRWEAHTALVLGRALSDAGDEQRAHRALRRAEEAVRRWCPGALTLAEIWDARGSLARRYGDVEAAVSLHRRALALWTERLGPGSGPAGGSLYALAQALHRAGSREEAVDAMRAAFLVAGTTLGVDHVDTWITGFELGRLEMDAGEPFEGLARMERARGEVARRLGAQHPVVRAMDRWL